MRKSVTLSILSILIAACTSVAPKEGNGTVSSTFQGKVDYDTYFTPERLRLDLILAGNSTQTNAYLSDLHRESLWAGSPEGLIDPFGYGGYYMEAFTLDGQLIYSHGFNALYDEWKTTAQAETCSMAMSQSLWMPFPKQPVRIVLYSRKHNDGMFYSIFECNVDPQDRHIKPGAENDFTLEALQEKGDRAHKVDLLFLGEGYTKSEMPKLRNDAERIMEYFFSMEPYASRRDDFNIWLLDSWSEDSGVDIPQNNVWKKSVMNSSFDTFYVDRYLTITDHRSIASAASSAPFDALFIIANDSKYGGGGIYNSYSLGTADNAYSMQVAIHEFGHGFAGLGDEYYNAETAYQEYYSPNVEPWEPNITTQVDFDSKWKDMIESDTPVPTPNDTAYIGKVGLFEGAGYMTYGCWRPYYECRMLNNTAPCFCPVCQRAISRMIDFYIQ